MNHAVVCIDAMGKTGNLFERREDALGMSVLGVCKEFDIVGLDGEYCLFNKVLVNCIEPPHEEFRTLRGTVKLGVAAFFGPC